jgi:hypothetical protein
MAEDTTRIELEAFGDRLREFLLSLPPEGQRHVAADLNRTIDRWQDWIQYVGTWETSY